MGMKSFVKVVALAAGIGAVFTASAVAGQTAASSGGEERRKASDDPNRRVCRTIVQSGSRLSSRVCRTQADWDREMRETQDAALAQQTGPGFRPEPPGPQ